MNESAIFSIQTFFLLTGCELARYVEPFIAKGSAAVHYSAYDVLRQGIATFDNEHIVYALEICMLLNETEFASQLPKFLSHRDASVSSTAFRLIYDLDPASVPFGFASAFTAVPIVDLFTTNVISGGEVHVGTNKTFVDKLIAKFDA